MYFVQHLRHVLKLLPFQGAETLLCGNPRVSLRLPWAFALTGRDCSNTRYPGCRFACPGLCAPLGFQPVLAKSEMHHKRFPFQDEYRQFLLSYDEAYVLKDEGFCPYRARLLQHAIPRVSLRLPWAMCSIGLSARPC